MTIIVVRRATPVPTLETDRSTNRFGPSNTPEPTRATSIRGVPTDTVTVDVATPVLPLASRNANVTFVAPIGNSVVASTGAPSVCAVSAMGAVSTASRAPADSSHAARAGHDETRVPSDAVAGIASAAGGVTTGAVVSRTTMRAVAI